MLEIRARANRREAAAIRLDHLRGELAVGRQELDEWVEAAGVVRSLAQAIQQQVFTQIEQLVTHSLQYIFGDEYEAEIVWVQKRSKSEASVMVKRGGMQLDPLDACGGGVVDVVSFALRLAAIVSDYRGDRRRLLLLDEPFKFLSEEYRPAAAALLQELSERLHFQVILVSHDAAFSIGNVIEV